MTNANLDKSSNGIRWVTAIAVGIALIAGVWIVIDQRGGTSSPDRSVEPPPLATAGQWVYPNADLSNGRATGGPIDSSSVVRLRVAWTLPIGATSPYGSYAAAPIVVGGVVYSQDLDSNVQAISLQTGRVLWSKRYDSPDDGPNGVVVADGRVFGATATSAFALARATGRQLWSIPLVRNAHEGIDMVPGYHDGVVYVSTVPGNTKHFYAGNGTGILWALDGATGRRLWHFDTVPKDLWSPQHTDINSGGGLWYSPAFDDQGSMYIGVGNPGPFLGTRKYPWGSSRPGPDLYTDSLVKLDARTGRLDWYYQLTPHDIFDWDLQDPPILVHSGGRQTVIAAGKAGVVLSFDRRTGKLLWRRSVGIHNGHDSDSIYAMRGEYSRLKLPETVYPGKLGGVETPMAANGATLFVPVVNYSVEWVSQAEGHESSNGTGEMVALDTATGAVRWIRKLPSPVYGSATVVNDLVFTTTYEGILYALAADTGKVVWQTRLPAASIAGVTVAGNTLIASAGAVHASGQRAELVAYRLTFGGGAASQTRQPVAKSPSTSALPSNPSGAGGALTGATIFSQNCAGCHTLAAAGATGTVGPNLDSLKPSLALVIHQVTAGGSIMPSFVGRLTAAQIRAVAQFVASAAGKQNTSRTHSGGSGGP
jgi:outer membrane protein assembly factor BamB